MADAWSFDPVAVGQAETAAWVHYYRHEWRPLLKVSLALVREGFGTGPLATVRGAWYVMRANQVWAPYPDNRPDLAREYMRRFYSLVTAGDRWPGRFVPDPDAASRREVEWWRIHRVHQREAGLSERDLTRAVAHLYAYVYGLDEAAVTDAARLRVEAMALSDAWVEAGCHLEDPRLRDERLALVASYSRLREAIDRHVVAT